MGRQLDHIMNGETNNVTATPITRTAVSVLLLVLKKISPKSALVGIQKKTQTANNGGDGGIINDNVIKSYEWW